MSVTQHLNPFQKGSSLIHRGDPRIKLILALAYIFTTSLVPHAVWVVFPILFSIPLSIAVLSELGIRFILKRSLWALPFVISAIPLLFTVDGLPWFQLNLFGLPIIASWAGFERVVSIVLKAWFSVQAAVLLISTTKFEEILHALRWLRIPKLLVSVIGLMWRYLFVMVEEVQRLMTARASRSSVLLNYPYGGKVFWRAKVAGYMAGNLFLRSLERSDRVYAAMLARGYDGEIRSLNSNPLSWKGRLLIIIGLLFGFLLVGISNYFGGVY